MITGQITTGQMAIGQMTTGQIATGQMATGQMATGQLTTGQIVKMYMGRFQSVICFFFIRSCTMNFLLMAFWAVVIGPVDIWQTVTAAILLQTVIYG
jgi:hypothetical protein